MFGYGYTSQHLAKQLNLDGWSVVATYRSPVKLRNSKVSLVHWNDVDEHSFKDVTHILTTIPPERSGDAVLLKFSEMFRKAQHIRWIGYLSTTGIYGDTNGLYVNEKSYPNPSSERAKLRLNAEREWLGLLSLYNLPIHIFRLAGIYGLGRNILMRLISNNVKIIELAGHKFSRIHVDDLITVLQTSMVTPKPGEVYNVCDNEPASQADVVRYGCRILEIKEPESISFDVAKVLMSSKAREFWQDNRLVDNSKIRSDLKVTLQFPTYREGLMEIHKCGILDNS